MTDSRRSSLDYEAEAFRLRRQMIDTIEELRANLRPAQLVDEAAEAAGVDSASAGGMVASLVRRHPLPSAAIALGVGLLAYSSFARRRANGAPAESSLPRISSSLAESAAGVLHERGESRRQQFVTDAKARVAYGAASVADRIDAAIGDLTDGLPGSDAVRPLLQGAIQLALSAGIEAVAAGFRR